LNHSVSGSKNSSEDTQRKEGAPKAIQVLLFHCFKNKSNFELTIKAANQGDVKAQFMAGVCYFKGEGVAQDQDSCPMAHPSSKSRPFYRPMRFGYLLF
jgi:TPR repeat protein